MFFRSCAYLITRLLATLCFRSEVTFKGSSDRMFESGSTSEVYRFVCFIYITSNAMCISISSPRLVSRLVPVPGRSRVSSLASRRLYVEKDWEFRIRHTASNRSATNPTSATWKIGASASLLIAAITFESFIPAKCWIAPEIPAAK